LTLSKLLDRHEYYAITQKISNNSQIRLGDVKHGIPGIKPFGGEYLEILGQTQSRQPLPQVAHIDG
jgi:hypothetical protein